MCFSALLSPPIRQGTEICKIGILRDPSFVIRPESRQIRLDVVRLAINSRFDRIPRKRIVQRALTDVVDTEYVRVRDVRDDSLMLCAVPRHPIEFCFGDFQLAAVQRDQRLNRALAERLCADHQSPLVVLNRSSKNFRGRGRKSIDQYRKRAIPRRSTVLVTIDSCVRPARFSHLNRGTRSNK